MTPARRAPRPAPAPAPAAAPAPFGVLVPVGLRPLGATPAWEAAVTASHGQCTCTGQCGAGHVRTEGRCPHSFWHGAHRLYAAPPDLAESVGSVGSVGSVKRARYAAGAPGSGLVAWCGPCLDGARRAASRAPLTAPAPPTAPGLALFDAPSSSASTCPDSTRPDSTPAGHAPAAQQEGHAMTALNGPGTPRALTSSTPAHPSGGAGRPFPAIDYSDRVGLRPSGAVPVVLAVLPLGVGAATGQLWLAVAVLGIPAAAVTALIALTARRHQRSINLTAADGARAAHPRAGTPRAQVMAVTVTELRPRPRPVSAHPALPAAPAPLAAPCPTPTGVPMEDPTMSSDLICTRVSLAVRCCGQR